VSGREVFRFLAFAWDVTEGHRRAADYPIHQVDVTVLAGFATLIRVNPADLDQVDLTRPILIAPIPELGDLVIDGGTGSTARCATGSPTCPPAC
jgi:hypothetical protein